jgi:Fe-S-cluster containining protein
LNYPEWLNIVKQFGVEYTSCDLSRLYLKRKTDGSCVFLYRFGNRWLCGLQNMKPRACKLWPFKIYSKPRFGRAHEAFYQYAGSKLFVYVDPNCSGIMWGIPTKRFVHEVLPEFIAISLGKHVSQRFSTGRLKVYPSVLV